MMMVVVVVVVVEVCGKKLHLLGQLNQLDPFYLAQAAVAGH